MSSVVPVMNGLGIPRLDELEEHIQHLAQDPEAELDVSLIEEVERQLHDGNTPVLLPRLLPILVQVLRSYQRDPTPICNLTLKLISHVSFTDAIALAPQEVLMQALESPSPALNLLAIEVLETASKSGADVEILANFQFKPLVQAFLTRWLASPSSAVGDRVTTVLADLLDTDSPTAREQKTDLVKSTTPGSGRFWKEIFSSDCLNIICQHILLHKDMDKKQSDQVTLAQGRIFGIVPRLTVLDPKNMLAPLKGVLPATPQISDGLLYMSALHMIDESDILMQMNLSEFLQDLTLAVFDSSPLTPDELHRLGRVYALIVSDPQKKPIQEELLALPRGKKVEDGDRDRLNQFIKELLSAGQREL